MAPTKPSTKCHAILIVVVAIRSAIDHRWLLVLRLDHFFQEARTLDLMGRAGLRTRLFCNPAAPAHATGNWETITTIIIITSSLINKAAKQEDE